MNRFNNDEVAIAFDEYENVALLTMIGNLGHLYSLSKLNT